ncbi:hypothetical protein GCM10020331_040520 [Ectobacillus funiculus]
MEIELVPYELTGEQREEVERLAKEKNMKVKNGIIENKKNGSNEQIVLVNQQEELADRRALGRR